MKESLRPVSEVSAHDCIESLNSKPITLLHPSEDVSPENVKKLQVGFTGTDASWDGLNAYVTMTITDATAIKEMLAGRVRAVSCGYDAELMQDSGNWQGIVYDEVMRNIRHNHIALVREGRAGDGVRFRIGDSADFDKMFCNNDNAPKGAGDRTMARKCIIDGAEYEADEKVIDSLNAANKARDEALDGTKKLQAQLDSMTAARDAAIAERDQLKAKMKDESEITRLVDEKVALLDSARAMGVEVKSSDSSDTIRAAFVLCISSSRDIRKWKKETWGENVIAPMSFSGNVKGADFATPTLSFNGHAHPTAATGSPSGPVPLVPASP